MTKNQAFFVLKKVAVFFYKEKKLTFMTFTLKKVEKMNISKEKNVFFCFFFVLDRYV